MDGYAHVFELDIMLAAIRGLDGANAEIAQRCEDGLSKAETILQQTQDELHFSEGLLNLAKAEEAVKLGIKIQAEVRLASALAQQTAAIASANPFAIAAAAAEVYEATAELAKATEDYQMAVEHRERLEHRYELAVQCVNIAQEMTETLNMRFQYEKAKVNEIISIGNARLKAAYEDLSGYLSRISPTVFEEITDFYSYKPEKNKPVTPKDVHDRLNASSNILNAVLEYLYITDINFHGSVDSLSQQLQIAANETSVETKIKKNIVGRLCEELVIRCFASMGERIETQSVTYLEDGSYTRADLILYGLKEPLILGRGTGMGAQKGGCLGIEVKSGYKEYLFAQLGHMEKQARGYEKCDLSCTVCTRDITDLPAEKQELLRARLREAGSPILGMLPYKAQLDEICIRFVKAKAGKEDV